MTVVGIHSWDWRGHPNIDALDRIVSALTGGRLRVRAVDTGSDQYAVAISIGGVSAAAARAAYDRFVDGGDEIAQVRP